MYLLDSVPTNTQLYLNYILLGLCAAGARIIGEYRRQENTGVRVSVRTLVLTEIGRPYLTNRAYSRTTENSEQGSED